VIHRIAIHGEFWTVILKDGGAVVMTAEELSSYAAFNRRCLRELRVFYHPMSAKAWSDMLHAAAQSAMII
jgi:hypothetical protein